MQKVVPDLETVINSYVYMHVLPSRLAELHAGMHAVPWLHL
jgi:hypothetical protein